MMNFQNARVGNPTGVNQGEEKTMVILTRLDFKVFNSELKEQVSFLNPTPPSPSVETSHGII